MREDITAEERETIDCACGIIVRDTRILLGLRAADRELYPDVWDVFGGHVEPGETVEEALARELREELGITPIDAEFLVAITEPDPVTNGSRLYHFYKVTDWYGPDPVRLGDEHTEIRWFSIEQAACLNLAAAEYHELFRQAVGRC